MTEPLAFVYASAYKFMTVEKFKRVLRGLVIMKSDGNVNGLTYKS